METPQRKISGDYSAGFGKKISLNGSANRATISTPAYNETLWRGPRGGDMVFSVRSTSRERFWSGFDATLYDTSGGFAETSVFAQHSLSMYVGDLRLAELADIAEMSASHFKVLFRQSVGVPVHQFVIQSRVEQAICLLREDSLPLSDIAMRTGFANENHMARCVRPVTGMPPSFSSVMHFRERRLET